MNDNYFLDTNIIVYSFEESSKGRIAKDLISSGLKKDNAKISYQVVQEFISVSTRKFESPLRETDILIYLQKVLVPLWSVYSSVDLVRSALDIRERWQYGFYDSLIIASAISSDCPILFSEDLQHGQKIYSTEIRDPFK